MNGVNRKISLPIWVVIIIVGILATATILVLARNFIYPLLLAILIAYLLLPLASRLEAIRIPRPIAIVLSILVAMTVIGGIVFFLYNRIAFFLSDFPILRANAQENLAAILNTVETNFGFSVESQKAWLRQGVNDFFDAGAGNIQSTFSATTSTIFSIGIMPVYVFFILYYRNRFKNFVLMLISKSKHEKTKQVLDQISDVTQRYVGGVVTVVLILCVLNSVGLLIVGIKYAVMFGILSALMNLVPYFGTLIGGAIPLVFTLLSDTPEKAIGIIILFIIIQFIENNILTPNITGGAVQINPLFTILGIVAAGMMWGIPGMLLIVPVLGIVKIIFENIESMHPYAYIIGADGPRRYIRLGQKNKSSRKDKTKQAA